MEYNGFKCYMDPRAEVFYLRINKKDDIFDEFYNLENRILDKQEFLQKYNFTHLLVMYSDVFFEDETIDNYTLKISNDIYKIYMRNDLLESE